MYGSILMDVTGMPQCLRITPREEATTPFPIPEITPPVTRMYFIFADLSARIFMCQKFIHFYTGNVRLHKLYIRDKVCAE